MAAKKDFEIPFRSVKNYSLAWEQVMASKKGVAIPFRSVKNWFLAWEEVMVKTKAFSIPLRSAINLVRMKSKWVGWKAELMVPRKSERQVNVRATPNNTKDMLKRVIRVRLMADALLQTWHCCGCQRQERDV